MSDEDALLAAIIANPDEDTPRLIYADWLQENGQPERAEFIRVQIERASTHAISDQIRQQLLSRETALLNRFRKEWLRPFQTLLHTTTCKFRRGFVEQVEADAEFYSRSATELFRLAPVRSVVLRPPIWSDLRTLSLSERPTGVRLQAVLGGFTKWHPKHPVDLLCTSPLALEPWIACGEWFVLAWAVASGPDWEAATRLKTLVATTRRWSVSVALRPYNCDEEFPAWSREFKPAASLRWLRFSNGRLVWSHAGMDEPEEFRALHG